MGSETTGAVLDATKDTFDELVASGLVLVDVWAESCRPCVVLAPHLHTVADRHPELTVVKLDAGKARRKCMSLQVRGLPTMLLYQNGQEVARLTDTALVADKLDAWLATELDRLCAGDDAGTKED